MHGVYVLIRAATGVGPRAVHVGVGGRDVDVVPGGTVPARSGGDVYVQVGGAVAGADVGAPGRPRIGGLAVIDVEDDVGGAVLALVVPDGVEDAVGGGGHSGFGLLV